MCLPFSARRALFFHLMARPETTTRVSSKLPRFMVEVVAGVVSLYFRLFGRGYGLIPWLDTVHPVLHRAACRVCLPCLLLWGRRRRAARCRRHTQIGRRLPIARNFRPGPMLRSGMPQLGLAGNSRRRPPHPPARCGRVFTAGCFAGCGRRCSSVSLCMCNRTARIAG